MILASTDHAFPYRLGDQRLQFNTLDITSFIFAGEVPPSKMYELLTTRWGMGRNLAVTLIDHYGGHISDIFCLLKELAKKKKSFKAISVDQIGSVQRCLKFNGDKKHMRELLTQIAEKGFAPLSDVDDPEAEIISRKNVGGYVKSSKAKVIGLPEHVWLGHELGLIPSKQSMRLVIATILHRNPEILAGNATANSTSVVHDMKKLGAIGEQSIGITEQIEEVESDIKATSDPEE